jgi:hypothetical protein
MGDPLVIQYRVAERVATTAFLVRLLQQRQYRRMIQSLSSNTYQFWKKTVARPHSATVGQLDSAMNVLGLIVNDFISSIIVHKGLEVAHQLRAVAYKALRAVDKIFVGA